MALRKEKEAGIKPRMKGAVVEAMVPVVRLFFASPLPTLYYSTSKAFREIVWRARLGGIGDNFDIYRHVVIHSPRSVRIGDNVSIAEFVHIWGGGGVTIGDDVLIASHTVITSQTHDVEAVRYRDTLQRKSVSIGDNVWIGSGAMIMPGVTIGGGAIVGAGSVVTKDVAEGSVVAGVPARTIRTLSDAERGES